jgi:hypothetical protein
MLSLITLAYVADRCLDRWSWESVVISIAVIVLFHALLYPEQVKEEA